MLTRRYWFACCALALGVSACGVQKYNMRGSELAPAADAHIKAKINEQAHMTELDIKASDLTPPDRLVPQGNAYVIWTRPEKSEVWSRAGALALKDDGRKGHAELTVPASAFDLAITAESNVNAEAPSGKTVIEGHVEED